jgi:ABC-2 type transport system ATP-binding protein
MKGGSTMPEPAIVIEDLTKRFGSREAVRDLSLEVPRGSVFGLLGQNGAGKSTTIKTLLNLYQPTRGRLSVLGLDSGRQSVELRRKVGYLPEEPSCYRWMTVAEAVRFNAAFYPTWDAGLADALLRKLELPRERRLGELSRGMQAKVGLVLALAPRPEVLILDDPTSGLDAVVRREFLEAMIANVQAEGGTVFFSTHLLHEMERVADEVAILHRGRLLVRDSLERLKAATKKLRVVYPDRVPERVQLPGMLRVVRDTHQALITVGGYHAGMAEELRRAGAESVEALDLSLEEIFVEAVQGQGGEA